MCGISGFVGEGDETILKNMGDSLAHRGPDGTFLWHEGPAYLAHNRLAIIDLSESGNQPMRSTFGNHTIAFNGEIYNYKELKQELSKEFQFKTASDTEVILAAYRKWGSLCFSRLNGMFAIALYDADTEELLLARDPLGKKPLYISIIDGTCVFGSEIKSLLKHPLISREIDGRSLAHYLRAEYIPTPRTIFKRLSKVLPGYVLRIKNGVVKEEQFWRPEISPIPKTHEEIKDRFDQLLDKAVSRRLVSDVPLGVFLSGGIDSSTVSYYAAKNSAGPIQTFSIGFEEKTFDESPEAALVASHIGAKHTTLTLSGDEALPLVEKIPYVFDEPVADASVLPTLLLSRFTREQVTVALGGDGADELLLGYPTFKAEQFASRYASLPEAVRSVIRMGVNVLPSSSNYFSFDYKAKKFVNDFDEHVGIRHMQWLGSFREEELQSLLTKEYAIQSKGITKELLGGFSSEYTDSDTLNELSHLYLRTYCMDDVLVKVDRASMHYSLEVRAPFLDKDLVSFLLSVPSKYKYSRGVGKLLLKQVMRGRLPDEILDRSKKGFAAPIAAWLRGPLKPMMLDLLSSDRLKNQGIFTPQVVEKLVGEHLSGSHDHRKALWTLLVFQLWYDAWAK